MSLFPIHIRDGNYCKKKCELQYEIKRTCEIEDVNFVSFVILTIGLLQK